MHNAGQPFQPPAQAHERRPTLDAGRAEARRPRSFVRIQGAELGGVVEQRAAIAIDERLRGRTFGQDEVMLP
jgi:hypothetical protein